MALSRVLVSLQFLLIFLISYPLSGSVGWWQGLWITSCGCLLGLWCLLYNRPGHFNIRPEVHPNAVLITTGPYHWVRHPMYTAVGLFCLGMVLVHQTLFSVIGLILLCPVLWLKAIREEFYLGSRFPEYGSEMASVKRFIPFIL